MAFHPNTLQKHCSRHSVSSWSRTRSKDWKSQQNLLCKRLRQSRLSRDYGYPRPSASDGSRATLLRGLDCRGRGQTSAKMGGRRWRVCYFRISATQLCVLSVSKNPKLARRRIRELPHSPGLERQMTREWTTCTAPGILRPEPGSLSSF